MSDDMEKYGTIRDIKDRDDLSLVSDSYDVNGILDYIGASDSVKDDIDGLFVKTENAEYTEVYGFRNNVPYLSKRLWKLK